MPEVWNSHSLFPFCLLQSMWAEHLNFQPWWHLPDDENLTYLAGLLGDFSEIKFDKLLNEMPDSKVSVEQTQVGCCSLLGRSVCFLPGKLCLSLWRNFFFLFLGGCYVFPGLCKRSAKSQSIGSNVSHQERNSNVALSMLENCVFPSDSTSEPSKTELSLKC